MDPAVGDPHLQHPIDDKNPSQPILSQQADVMSKAIHINVRHGMSTKKHVVIQKCEICNIELIGQVVIDAHLKGSKHAKKLKAKQLLSNLIDSGQVRVDNAADTSGVYKCDICNVSMNSTQQLEVHYAGARHKAKAGGGADAGTAETIAQEENISSGITPSDTGEQIAKIEKSKPTVVASNPLDLMCTVCNITVNSPQQLDQHLHSKKHKEREAGRVPQRPGPYSRGRGGRGGLGSQGRGGGKGVTSKFTSLSNSFKSAGYSNTSFIKPEGGVIMPPSSNKGSDHSHTQQNSGKPPNYGNQFKNRSHFGSLTPYVNTDSGRGGFPPRGRGAARGGWAHSNASYGAASGYDYEQYRHGWSMDGWGGYGYGYENSNGYEMMQPGHPPSF